MIKKVAIKKTVITEKDCDKKKKRLKKIAKKLHVSNYFFISFFYFSSIVNEGIRAILSLFIYLFFFYKKILYAQKAQKRQKAEKAEKAQNANKRLSSP